MKTAHLLSPQDCAALRADPVGLTAARILHRVEADHLAEDMMYAAQGLCAARGALFFLLSRLPNGGVEQDSTPVDLAFVDMLNDAQGQVDAVSLRWQAAAARIYALADKAEQEAGRPLTADLPTPV